MAYVLLDLITGLNCYQRYHKNRVNQLIEKFFHQIIFGIFLKRFIDGMLLDEIHVTANAGKAFCRLSDRYFINSAQIHFYVF